MSQMVAITSQLAATKIADATPKDKENKPEAVKNSTEMMTNGDVGGTSEQEQEFTDPFCNADNPQIITFQDVTSAAFKIKKGIEYTPCPVRKGDDSFFFIKAPRSLSKLVRRFAGTLINGALIITNWHFY